MVELADGRLRPEQRHHPVARERDERHHVVALVGVEPAAGVDPRDAGAAPPRPRPPRSDSRSNRVSAGPSAAGSLRRNAAVSAGRIGAGARPSCSRRRPSARSGRSRRRDRRYRIATRSSSAFTNTKNAWPSSSIRATASSSNIGSMLKRLTLTTWPRRSSGSRRTCASTLGATAAADRLRRLPDAAGLAVVDRAPLDLVEDGVDPGLVRRGGGRAAQRLAVDDERHVDDVRVLHAPVLLDRQLDRGVRSVVEEALEPAELPLRVRREPAPAPRSSCP